MFKILIIIISIVFVSSCATSKIPSISSQALNKETLIHEQNVVVSKIGYQKKLDDLSYPLLQGALPLCENKKTYSLGLHVINQYYFGEKYIEATKNITGIKEKLTVLRLIKNSPSANVDIQKGDEIISVNGNKIKNGKEALNSYRKYLAKAYENNLGVEVTLSRNNKKLTRIIKPTEVCDYQLKVDLSTNLNAFANGDEIHVFSTMMNVFNDDQLSFIIAHEMAHNTEGHIGKLYSKYAIGAILGGLISPSIGITTLGGVYVGVVSSNFVGTKQLEEEADYVALYILANSGVNLYKTKNVWRKFSSEQEIGIHDFFLLTHPVHPSRYLVMQEAINEIESKILKGEVLLPNRK
jgi:membrane-associated protease RseP (regulator of RpoE activity)